MEGYDAHDYEEYSVVTSLQFPRLVVPFLSNKVTYRSTAKSEISVSWDLQNRPEFHRRVFSAAWKYGWSNPKRHTTYDLDLLDLNYVYMPWISATFKHDYLDSVSNRNAILRYNYEDLFIMKTASDYSTVTTATPCVPMSKQPETSFGLCQDRSTSRKTDKGTIHYLI